MGKLTPAEAKRRSKVIRVVVAALAGFGIGQLCHFLPPAHQGLCHLAAKLVGLVFGGG
jgi:hypothetical protein